MYEDVLVKVELREPSKIRVIQVNEEFNWKFVVALDCTMVNGRPAVIHITFEDDSTLDLLPNPEQVIYRTYQTIAVDETK